MALFLGFRVVLRPFFWGWPGNGPFSWDSERQWPSGVSSGIELLFPGAPLNGIEWYCGPLSGVSSGIELLFPGI